MNWYLTVLKKYATFSGRARRKEYWMFVLFNFIFSICAAILDGVFGTFNAELGMGVIGTIYMLAVFLPSLAVSVRRLHDTNKSGWWLLLLLIPLIGAIVILVFMCMDSKEENEFGVNPKLAI